MKDDRLRYGPHVDQWVDVRIPVGVAPLATVVLVHGGYWRTALTADLMTAMVEDLSTGPFIVANVEYRRGPEEPWPAAIDDVRLAIGTVAHVVGRSDGQPAIPMIAIGHSVGGLLALRCGDPLDAVVALAPVTDAARTWTEGLGENAAAEYFGEPPERLPGAYADASPVHRLPLGRPALIVHGADDERVPIRHTLDYLACARQRGDVIDAWLPHHLPHRAAIDPTTPAWTVVRSWIADRQAPRSSSARA